MFEDLVREKEKELLQNNLNDLRENINNSDYKTKIENYSQKFNFNPDEVKAQILSNDLVASFFIKEPAKQNFTEKLVSSLLKTTVLPQSGKSCIRFTETGDIVSKKDSNTSKSADFHINTTYITQKYTRGNGGAQDNQYNDVVDFLIKGSKHHKVAAIVDGSFWDEKRKELREFFHDNPNVKISSMDEVLNGVIRFD